MTRNTENGEDMNAESLVNSFKDGMAKLSRAERQRAIESVQGVIRAALFDDSAGEQQGPRCCPRCGSVAFVKKGRSADGSHRHLCKDCGRTFGAKSERILGTTKLPKETWMAYAECFVLMLPLRECADRCGVCLKTAFTMRHRLIECLTAFSPAFGVASGCGCELDETYFAENFKGNHTLGTFELPRPARHRGGCLHLRGLSGEQICVMTGINDSGDALLEVSGRGTLSKKRAVEFLKGRIEEGSVVATDKATAYPSALRELGVAAHRAYDSKDRSKGTINRVNNVHAMLASFMTGFRGVSTKHLQAYLAWFIWHRSFARSGSRLAEPVVARQIANGLCRTRIRDMFNVYPPFMEYWGKRAA